MTSSLFPAQLAKRWDCSTTLIYDLLNSGDLSGFRLGKLWRIRAEAVVAYAEGQEAPSEDTPEPSPAEPGKGAAEIARMTRLTS